MPFLSFLPSEANLITDSYNIVVDALFGFSFKGPPRADFATVLETLKNVEVPIASIDVPSGKDIYSYLCIYYHPSGVFFQINWGPSWSWWYGSWIVNYLCNQCLSPLMLWVRISIRTRCSTLYDKAKFVNDLWLVGGFLRILRYPPPIKLTDTI